MYYYCKTVEELNNYLDNPNFSVMNVWGDKPSSENFKKGIGFWKVSGYWKKK